MKHYQAQTVINMVFLLIVCALSACGKTGELYLPDSGAAASKDAAAETAAVPKKTQ